MIKLIEDFYIEVDADQFTLVRIKDGKNKQGEPIKVKKVYGYFGDITGCLERCKREIFAEKLATSTVSLSTAIDVLKSLTDRLSNLITEEVYTHD